MPDLKKKPFSRNAEGFSWFITVLFRKVHFSGHNRLKEIYLEEKNIAPSGYQITELESKGFLPEVTIQDFPIRGQKVALRIKRRRWTVKKTGGIISRDWDLVRKGARMTTEFGLFLKGIFG